MSGPDQRAGEGVSEMTEVERVLRRTASWMDVVRGVAQEFGETPNEDEAGYILWNHTGYPSFWHGDPVTCCEVYQRTSRSQAASRGNENRYSKAAS